MNTSTRTTITHTDGRQVSLPARYAANLKTQTAVNTVVDDAFNPHPLAVATTRALQVHKTA